MDAELDVLAAKLVGPDWYLQKMLMERGPLNTFNKTPVPLHHSPDDPGMMGIDWETGILLKNFVESRKPKNIIELGTFRGYSTSWLILGTLLAGDGRVDAYECMPEGHYGPMHYDRLGLPKDNFIYHPIPGGIWEHAERLPEYIDFIYHDTSHLLDPTIQEMELLLPRLAVGGIILFDDMDHPMFRPMQTYLYRLFNELAEKGEYRWQVLHLGHGLGIAEKLK